MVVVGMDPDVRFGNGHGRRSICVVVEEELIEKGGVEGGRRWRARRRLRYRAKERPYGGRVGGIHGPDPGRGRDGGMEGWRDGGEKHGARGREILVSHARWGARDTHR